MDVLPHLSSYLLIYSFVLNFLFWFMPAPYGKFAINDPPAWTVSIVPNSVFRVLIFIWFGTLYWGWFEGVDWTFYNTWPTSNRGMFILIWLSVYYVWRLVSPAAFSAYGGNYVGDKKVSLFAFFLYAFFWGPAGWYWRKAASTVSVELEFYDYILMILLALFLGLNVYSDITKNDIRENGKEFQGIGRYLNEAQLYERFSSLEGLWNTFSLPPNYMFEVAHWFVFIFVSHSWQGLWWFCCIFMFLVTRGVWQKKWYRTETVSSIVSEEANASTVGEVQRKLTF